MPNYNTKLCGRQIKNTLSVEFQDMSKVKCLVKLCGKSFKNIDSAEFVGLTGIRKTAFLPHDFQRQSFVAVQRCAD